MADLAQHVKHEEPVRIRDSSGPSPFSKKISKAVGYLTLVLVSAILFFFLILPVGMIITKAFWGPEGFTLSYFGLLFANDLQTSAVINSLWIGVTTTVICAILCFPLALWNARYDFPGKAIISSLLLVPMVMPPFVGAIGIQRFFARRGSVNIFLLDQGWITEPIDWLADANKFWAVVILEVLHLYPIAFLNLTAALANIDPALEEAAQTVGAPRWKRLVHILWPLASPGVFAGSIIVFIWSLTDLGTPLLVGFHDTMPVRIFNMVTDVNENPVGYALVFCVIVLTAGIFLFSKAIMARKRYDMMARGHVSGAVRKASWRAMPVIYAFSAAVIVLAMIPHASVLITSFSDDWFMTVLPESYTLKYYQLILESPLSKQAVKNSILLAAGSTLVDLLLGLLIAYVIVRKLVPFTGLLDSLVMMPLALPGIVLAFGYVVTYSGTFLDPLNYPVPLLIIAYAIRRLPFMVRSAASGLQQTGVSLEEASYTFGASKFYTMQHIVVPLVMANLIAGALLCFAYAMLDVSDSLILAMKDQYYPLTKAIYALFLEQGSGEFAASALGVTGMLILASCILGASLLLGKKMGELFRS